MLYLKYSYATAILKQCKSSPGLPVGKNMFKINNSVTTATLIPARIYLLKVNKGVKYVQS